MLFDLDYALRSSAIHVGRRIYSGCSRAVSTRLTVVTFYPHAGRDNLLF